MKMTQLFLLIFALLLASCSSFSIANSVAPSGQSSQPSALNSEDYKLIHQIYGKDKKHLGSIYAKYVTEEVFASMIIKEPERQKEILYSVDSAGFVGKDGVDMKISINESNQFYGYKVIIMKDDYIQLAYLSNKGKNISDYITIEWSYDRKKFQVLKAP